MAAATPRSDEPAQETIWTRPDRGTRGPHPQHSRETIAAAAVALAASGGLAAVSMRSVAAELGTGAGTLYRYLSSREDLLDLMVDAVLAELPLHRPPDGAWLDDLVVLAHDHLALYRRHPWLLDTNLRPGAIGPHALALFEQYLRIMAPVACTATAKLEAVAMVTGVVTLFARTTSTGRAQPTSPSHLFAAATRHEHPHLVAALGQSAPPSRPDLFERTVRSVLCGVTASETPPMATPRVAAGALLLDEVGRVLPVKPHDKE